MARTLCCALLVWLAMGHPVLAAEIPNLSGVWKAEKASLYSIAKGYENNLDMTLVVHSQKGSEFEGSLRYVTSRRTQGLMNVCGTLSADGKRVFIVSKKYAGQGDINADGSMDLYLLKPAADSKAVNLHLAHTQEAIPPSGRPAGTWEDIGD